MKLQRLALVPLVALALAGSAAADDTGNFVVLLGQDTTSVEHYSRSASQLEVNQVGRAPRVLQRHFVYDYQKGALTHLAVTVMPPGGTTPTQTVDATWSADTLRMQIRNGSAPVQNVNFALPPGALVLASSSPWTAYEERVMKLVQSKDDSLRATLYFIGAPNTDWLSLHRLGRDSVVISTSHLDVFHARVDKSGHILGMRPIRGTGQYTVSRVPELDVPAMAASFAAREQAGAGIGALSPRDTVRADNAGGAALWIDYGRPAKRGRAIFGGIVPFGEVWRTGANAATQFKTDKALDFGGTVVPAGFYTLWTVPSSDGWKLIVNGETGQWGTEHKAAKDLYTIDMKTGALPDVVERFTIGIDPNAQGGVIRFDWDTTRASAPFVVKP